MKGLYAIVDVETVRRRGLEPLDFAAGLLAARPAALQLRAKSSSARDTLALLRALKARCTAFGVPLFANDRPDLALLAACDGVHLGQTDVSAEDARRAAPGLALGLSTHTLAELDRALAEHPAYVAFGPVFATATKADAEPVVGLQGLAEAGARCRRASTPLVAIGGLTLERAPEVGRLADMGAVISALLPPGSPAPGGEPGIVAGAARLHEALGGRGRPI